MIPSIEISSLPAIAQRVLDANAPPKLRAGAAKGLLPGLKPAEVVTVLALLSGASDPEHAPVASDTLSKLPQAMLDGAFDAGLPPQVLEILAQHYLSRDDVLERIISSSTVAPDTVAMLAGVGSEAICERIAINEERLLSFPVIIEKLYMNKAARSSTADRVLELAVRHGIELKLPAFKEASQAIRDELISAPSDEPTPDDVLFTQVDQIARTIELNPDEEDTHELDEDGNEKVKDKCIPLWVQLGSMTVSQKIRRAMLGSATERMLLVRDTNRLVANAAIRSPQMKDNEVVQISASRSVSDDVLRVIATSKEWTQNHQIKFNLVTNPRTPFTFAAKLIPYLREHELKQIAKSKNVQGSVSNAARQHLTRKANPRGGGGGG